MNVKNEQVLKEYSMIIEGLGIEVKRGKDNMILSVDVCKESLYKSVEKINKEFVGMWKTIAIKREKKSIDYDTKTTYQMKWYVPINWINKTDLTFEQLKQMASNMSKKIIVPPSQ